MKVRTVTVALTVAAGAMVAAVAVTTDDPRRPPLRLPAASAFPPGPCRDAADVVLSLGRFTYQHTGASSLPADAYPFLRQRAEQLAANRNVADGQVAEDPLRQALSTRIDAVLTAIGFLRLRPGKAYDPALLRDLETTRADLQQTCVSQA
jgi:hypothetical protein